MTKQSQNKPVVRCAIYTRKSTDEGLDQDFNSLDAQREAGEAYIKSQKHEGWECSPEFYDDGGFSGGNLERPALKRLMADVEAGKIDVVVVYKVDRLSRSLLDFARLMGTFDCHGVSFCSVTQLLNTATSMGRLMLNVLLSFAQFEREIIGERIRDKIAAQRRRGKWAGGVPVMGYEVDRSNRSPKLTCTNAIHSGRQKCPSGSLPAAEMERIVVGHIREISTDAGLRDAVLQQARAHVDEELKALKTEQRQLQQQLVRQHAEIRQLAVDRQANSTARIADLHDQITQAENRLEHLRASIDDLSANRISNDDVAAAFADFDNLWESLSPREQADLLSLLIAGVEFDVRASTVSVTFHDAGIKTLAQGKPGEAA